MTELLPLEVYPITLINRIHFETLFSVFLYIFSRQDKMREREREREKERERNGETKQNTVAQYLTFMPASQIYMHPHSGLS